MMTILAASPVGKGPAPISPYDSSDQTGIGCLLEADDKYLVVKRVVRGLGADACGNLRLGDALISVDGNVLAPCNPKC